VLTGLIAITLRSVTSPQIAAYWPRLLSSLLAVALVGTLAWSGHAAAGTGFAGTVHLASDILHLVAAAAWLGALLPLAIVLSATAHSSDQPSAGVAREVVLRFSTLGIVSVGTLVATGIVNSWMLVGSVSALVGTNYGQLLLVKIALFFCMLAVAIINRLILTPRLMRTPSVTAQFSARQIGTNSLIEAGLGAAILLVVGVLGTLQPGIEAG
jgi:putative copper resistance protein D